MRRYRRYCLALIFIVFGAWLLLPGFLTHTKTWFRHLQTADVHTLSAAASNSLVYPVKPKQWLKFAISENDLQLRIITNAHIQRPETITPNASWAYVLHYEFLDKKGALLAKGLYHLHSRLTTYKDAQGDLIYGNYYSSKDLAPLDGRLILLGLKAMKGLALLRISLETVNPAIVETAVRVYVPTKISEYQVATLWLRMSQAQKDSLAKNSIYPASLLSTAEQTNLLRHQWQPIGPLGIEGQSYQTLTLYTLKDLEQDDQNALMTAAGLQADAQHYGVIPLPEKGGEIALTFRALDGSALTSPVSINLQWFGRDKEQRWQQDALWSKDTESLNYALDGGLLVIRPSSPVIVTAFLTTATKAKHDITDNLLSIKTYPAGFGVDFGVLHYQQQPAALRIDVRRLLTGAETPQHGSVRYQWLNDRQQIIAEGELNALDQPSLFDRVDNITDAKNVSDPLSYYFHLPEQVSRLRLLSNDPDLLVNAYNQPYGAAKKQRIPEDSYAANDKQDLQLIWFPLRALNDDSLTQQQAIQWLSGQYRPPEDSPDVQAGQYLWQDYIPQGEAEARYLLTDYTGEEVRAEALANVYCSLTVNRDTQVQLNAVGGLRSISPELIFLRSNASPFTAELFLNQQKVAAIDSIGLQGIMHLPETALGNQQIRLNTDSGGRWLMNYQAQCAGERYLKRRAFTLNADAALDFIVQHEAQDEILSARLYSFNDSINRSQVTVNIDAVSAAATGSAVSTNWTYKKRLYDIRPLQTKAIPVLYAQGQTVSNGERFSIPLNSDLSAGAYHIRIALAKGAAGLITLSQIKAGVHEQRRFYRESALETQ